MAERRVQAEILGPGSPGRLRVRLGYFDAEVPAERLPAHLRGPNSRFVAVVTGRDLLRVESEGSAWLQIQDKVRVVLNTQWDPIGVADRVSDEYDSYIADLYGLVRRGAQADEIAEYLRWVETDRMGLRPTPADHLLFVARSLLNLDLPSIA